MQKELSKKLNGLRSKKDDLILKHISSTYEKEREFKNQQPEPKVKNKNDKPSHASKAKHDATVTTRRVAQTSDGKDEEKLNQHSKTKRKNNKAGLKLDRHYQIVEEKFGLQPVAFKYILETIIEFSVGFYDKPKYAMSKRHRSAEFERYYIKKLENEYNIKNYDDLIKLVKEICLKAMEAAKKNNNNKDLDNARKRYKAISTGDYSKQLFILPEDKLDEVHCKVKYGRIYARHNVQSDKRELRLLDTQDGYKQENDQYHMFVINEWGSIFTHRKEKGVWQHSSFSNVGPLKAVGLWRVLKGKVTNVSITSGHYMSKVSSWDNKLCLLNTIKKFESKGIDLSDAEFKLDPNHYDLSALYDSRGMDELGQDEVGMDELLYRLSYQEKRNLANIQLQKKQTQDDIGVKSIRKSENELTESKFENKTVGKGDVRTDSLDTIGKGSRDDFYIDLSRHKLPGVHIEPRHNEEFNLGETVNFETDLAGYILNNKKLFLPLLRKSTNALFLQINKVLDKDQNFGRIVLSTIFKQRALNEKSLQGFHKYFQNKCNSDDFNFHLDFHAAFVDAYRVLIEGKDNIIKEKTINYLGDEPEKIIKQRRKRQEFKNRSRKKPKSKGNRNDHLGLGVVTPEKLLNKKVLSDFTKNNKNTIKQFVINSSSRYTRNARNSDVPLAAGASGSASDTVSFLQGFGLLTNKNDLKDYLLCLTAKFVANGYHSIYEIYCVFDELNVISNVPRPKPMSESKTEAKEEEEMETKIDYRAILPPKLINSKGFDKFAAHYKKYLN